MLDDIDIDYYNSNMCHYWGLVGFTLADSFFLLFLSSSGAGTVVSTFALQLLGSGFSPSIYSLFGAFGSFK